MAEYTIAVANRIATVDAGVELVCNNPTDSIRFEFDDEWSGHDTKTARFAWEGKHIDVPFSGNVVQIPEIFMTNYVNVGVFVEGITTTPVKVNCRYSIKCLGGKIVAPSDDVYDRIISLINELGEKGVTDAQIAAAVDQYLQENPIEAGATEEQAAQIEQNTKDIAELKETGGVSGEDGATFTPSVDDAGNLSWANDKGLENPSPVNIKGTDGVGIANVERTSGTGAAGTIDTYTISMTDGTSYEFTVYNGADGSGSSGGGSSEGDMKKSVYDTNNNGTVDNAEKLGGKLPTDFAAADHTHPEYAEAEHGHDEYLKSYTETDPTVPSWAKQSSKPSYTKTEVGLGNVDNVKQYSASNPPPYPVTSVNGKTGAVTVEIPSVPTKTSELTNDSGFITEYTETDPTVPAWAKAATKPSYTASEVGAAPDDHTHSEYAPADHYHDGYATEDHGHTLADLGIVYVDELPETGVEGILYLVPVE